LGDGPAIASYVEATQQSKGVRNLLRSRLELRSVNRVHRMQPAYLQLTLGTESLPIDEQSVVAESE
jgi:hypothetical protein